MAAKDLSGSDAYADAVAKASRTAARVEERRRRLAAALDELTEAQAARVLASAGYRTRADHDAKDVLRGHVASAADGAPLARLESAFREAH